MSLADVAPKNQGPQRSAPRPQPAPSPQVYEAPGKAPAAGTESAELSPQARIDSAQEVMDNSIVAGLKSENEQVRSETRGLMQKAVASVEQQQAEAQQTGKRFDPDAALAAQVASLSARRVLGDPTVTRDKIEADPVLKQMATMHGGAMNYLNVRNEVELRNRVTAPQQQMGGRNR